LGLGTAIAGTGLVSTGALTHVSADRGVSVATADGETALLGLVGQGPVKKNSREPMVELTNNTDGDLTITVSLANCNDGTLYDDGGGTGCSVSFTLGSGNSTTVDIEASATGTMGYTVTATGPDLSVEATGTVESQAGNVTGAIRIQKPKQNDFTASTGNGDNGGTFTADKVDIRDEDGDADLTELRFRVREGDSGGDLVGSRDVTPPGDRYQENNVDVPVDPDYTITSGTTYALTLTAEDADGNTESETLEDTA
jgi:hypothetical protein